MKAAKVGMLTALMLSSQLSLAEFKHIEDDELSGVTGQKGLTIDIDMGIEIGEFMYQDGGSIVMQGLRLGGKDHGTGAGEVGTRYSGADGIIDYAADPGSPGFPLGNAQGLRNNSGGTTGLNNVRIEVDVAGDGSTSGQDITFSVFGTTFTIPVMDNQFFWAWGREQLAGTSPATSCGSTSGPPSSTDGCGYIANDGDLIIHATFINGGNNEDGRPHTIADFGMELDKFALKASSYKAGDDIQNHGGTSTTAQSTTILSNLRMEGYFGGFDMLLENLGNGFGEYDALGNFTETGVGDAASKIKINTLFEISEMEYDYDIIGVRYEKIAIHNKRNNHKMFDFLTQKDYTGPGIISVADSQGYAQTNTQLYAVKDTVLHVNSPSGVGSNNPDHFHDGIAFKTRFQGDMDIGHLSFGDTGKSIGEQYYTDMNIYTTSVFSAH